MKIVFSSIGTAGDFHPLIALAERLRERGHDLRMAVNEAMHGKVREAGLEALPCGPRFGPEEAARETALFDHWRLEASPEETVARWENHDLPGQVRRLCEACRGADLLIASSLQAAAPLVHEITGIPWTTAALIPSQFGAQEKRPGRKPDFCDWFRTVRRGLDRPDREIAPRYFWSPTILLASSRCFHDPVVPPGHHLHVTGFWFHGTAPSTPNDPSLLRFVESGSGFLVLSFGSLPLENARKVLALHARAADRLGLRLLVQHGWAGLSPHDRPDGISPEQVHFAGEIPHDWLFPRAKAVIHHGGIGTTARALRNACPMLVEPYGTDQFFNAWRVRELGAGSAMHPHQLTVDGLAAVLERDVLNEKTKERVRALAAGLEKESGLEMASDLISEMKD